MKIRLSYLRFSYMACIILIFGFSWSSTAQAATTYSGRAFAALVDITTMGIGPVYISDTGELNSNGEPKSNSLLNIQLDKALSAEVLVASSSGANDKAASSASLANVSILPGHTAQLTASFVRSESEAICSGVRGSSEIADLTFGNTSVVVTGQPNQIVIIPGIATLIINEQKTTSSENYHEITVNAIHLIVPGVAEVILSSTKSDISCEPQPPTLICHDFVTGGGWITVGKSRANFGFNAGFKDASTKPEVHLNYIDHSNDMKVKATSIVNYVASSKTGRHFEGSCEIDGIPGHAYSIEVADNGEPGRGADTIKISLSNGYSASGILEGGNIQLHAPCSLSGSAAPIRNLKGKVVVDGKLPITWGKIKAKY